MEGYTLTNGVVVPYIGYGTGVVNHYRRSPRLWTEKKMRLLLQSVKHLRLSRQLKMDLFAPQLVREAYQSGIRLFDTGRIYGDSEKAIGKGLKAFPRDSYFLTTKFSDLCFQMQPEAGYEPEDILGHLRKSLRYLQVDRVDLLLLHHPHGPVAEIWKQMEYAYRQGFCAAIGTSNFTVEDFKRLQQTQEIAPMVNQGERHPFFQNEEVFRYCRENRILFMAHTATGHGKTNQSELLNGLAKSHHKTPQQIVLRWHLQNGVVPIVSAASRLHIQQTAEIDDFVLSEEEMRSIDSLEDHVRLLDCANGVDDPKYRYNT